MRALLLALPLLMLGCRGPAALPEVRLEPAFGELEFVKPLAVVPVPGAPDHFAVVEQGGQAWYVQRAGSRWERRLFLDLRGHAHRGAGEQGLLSLAFHPGWPKIREVYVWYTAPDPRRGVLARLRARPDDSRSVDPASREVVLEVPQPWGNHNGGTALFGPDGKLYLSVGDGGGAGDPHGHGQNTATLLGSVLRLDVDGRDAGQPYAVPADNPLVGRAGARPEIWAWGLRNPWRMSFDRATGELWAGDVGQDLWEEVDVIVRGGDYGWNLREGRHAFGAAGAAGPWIEPVLEYGRDQGGSVTGGYVYRGARIPALAAAYVWGDFVSGRVWAARLEADRVLERRQIAATELHLSSFGEDHAGELLVVAFDGRVYRLLAD